MIVFTIRRVLMMIPVLIGASILAFGLVEVSGDPVADQIFVLEQSTGEPVPQSTIDAIEGRLYYDRSVPERYWLWLTGIGSDTEGSGPLGFLAKGAGNVAGALGVGDTNDDIGILQGKWGPSIEGSAIDIGGEIGSRFWITLRLVLFATFASVGIAILTGVISAVRQYSRTDYTLTFIGFLFLAMPTFWLGSLMKEAGVQLNSGLNTDVFRTYRDSSRGFQGNGWEVFVDALPYLIIPTLVLMLSGYAAISRYQRASMLEVLNSDYVRLARAKGVRNGTVMRRHALRTALIPIATFAPLSIAGAMGGSLVVERIFGWRGLGAFAYDSITHSDAFAVQAYMLISGVIVLMGVLVSDLLYGVLDPRIRYE